MEKVLSVKPFDDYTLVIRFDTGEIKKFDCKPFLNKGKFQQLKDINLFRQVYVDYDTVVWPNNLDISPDTLYDLSCEFNDFKN